MTQFQHKQKAQKKLRPMFYSYGGLKLKIVAVGFFFNTDLPTGFMHTYKFGAITFKGQSPQICTVRHCVTSKNQMSDPLSYREINKSLSFKCTKGQRNHCGHPLRAHMHRQEFFEFQDMSHSDVVFFNTSTAPRRGQNTINITVNK